MKFMKLGTRPDTFYTEEAARYCFAGIRCDKIINGGLLMTLILYLMLVPMLCRTVVSDVSSDLIIKINNITYHLHKVMIQLRSCFA